MSEIMSLEQFAEKVKDSVVGHLPLEFSGATVEIQKRRKVNDEPMALSVVPEGHDNQIAPCVYLDRFYGQYMDGSSLDDVIDTIADVVSNAYAEIDKVPYRENPMDKMDKSRVFMQLINTESNKELLENTPHREFNDMSVIYRVLYSIDETGMQSVVITNDLAEVMGVDEQELFDLASVQTKELFPPKIQSLASVLGGFMMDAGISDPDEISKELGFDDEFGMYLVSNEYNIQGATNMVYDDVLYEASGKLGENVYVLPSSIHEFLIVPASMGEPEELSKMVTEINREHVSQVDRLSNQVFYYDRENRELKQVSNVPIKGISDTDLNQASPMMFHSAPQAAIAR